MATVKELVWNGKVPLEVHLDDPEGALTGSCAVNASGHTNFSGHPYFIMASRIAYLPLLLPQIRRHFNGLARSSDTGFPAEANERLPCDAADSSATQRLASNPSSGRASPTLLAQSASRSHSASPVAGSSSAINLPPNFYFTCSLNDTKVILPWNLPIGLLFDLFRLVTADADYSCIPWRLALLCLSSSSHSDTGAPFASCIPFAPVLPLSEDAMMSSYFASLKEADYARCGGSARNVMNLSRAEQVQLFEAVRADQFDRFWKINSKLVGGHLNSTLKSIPAKCFVVDEQKKALIKRVQVPIGPESHGQTVGSWLSAEFPSLRPSRFQCIVHGAELPLEIKLIDLALNCAFADNFLDMSFPKYLSMADDIGKIPENLGLVDAIFSPDCLASLRLFDRSDFTAVTQLKSSQAHKVWLSKRFRAQNVDPSSFIFLLQKGWEIRDNPDVTLDNWNAPEERDTIPREYYRPQFVYFNTELWDSLENACGPVWQTFTVNIFINADSNSQMKIIELLDHTGLSGRMHREVAGDAMDTFMRFISLCALAHIQLSVPCTRENSPVGDLNALGSSRSAEQTFHFLMTSATNSVGHLETMPNVRMSTSTGWIQWEKATLYELASKLLELVTRKSFSEQAATDLLVRLLHVNYEHHVQFGDWFLNLLVIFEGLYPAIHPDLARRALVLFYSKSPSASGVCRLITILGLERSENDLLRRTFEETLPDRYIPLLYRMDCAYRRLPRLLEAVPFQERWQKFVMAMRTQPQIHHILQYAPLSFEIDSTSSAHAILCRSAFAVFTHTKRQNLALPLEQITSITDPTLGRTKEYSLKELVNHFFALFQASGLYTTVKAVHARPVIVPSPLLPVYVWYVLGQFIARAAILDIKPPFLLEWQLFETLLDIPGMDLTALSISGPILQWAFSECRGLEQEAEPHLRSSLLWISDRLKLRSSDRPELWASDMPELIAKIDKWLVLRDAARTRDPRGHMHTSPRHSIALEGYSGESMMRYRETEESERGSHLCTVNLFETIQTIQMKAAVRHAVEQMEAGFREAHPSASEFTKTENYALIFKELVRAGSVR